jgi:DNA-binding NarL/FixJ family response regulator
MIVPFASVYECTRFSDRKLDLIVYHSHAPDTVSLADILALRGAFSSVQIVVLSDATTMDPGVIREVLAQGASGFILTNQTGLQMVVSALSLVASGGTFVPKEFLFTKRPAADSATEPKASKLRHLTPRELDVLALIKQGKPNKEIARVLDMSPSTVKVHARSLMRKTGAANRVQLAINADKQIRQD